MPGKQYYKWVFTLSLGAKYSSYNETPKLFCASFVLKFFNEALADVGIKNFVFQLEAGKATGVVHYQGRFTVLKKSVKSTFLKLLENHSNRILEKFELEDLEDVRKVDCFGLLGVSQSNNIDELRPLISKRIIALATFSPQAGSDLESTNYVTKTEGRLAGPWAVPNIYYGQDLMTMNEETMYPWQRGLFEKLKSTPDSRTITWIHDPSGNVGKSFFMKWYCFNFKDSAKIPMGTSAQLKKSICSIGQKRAYFVDFPRTRGKDEDLENVVSLLEELKNGWVVSAMYGVYEQLLMEPPHVVIFSNFVPNKALLSNDRWEIYKINQINLTLHEETGIMLNEDSGYHSINY